MTSRIIKVEVDLIRLWMITDTENLIIVDITKSNEFNNCHTLNETKKNNESYNFASSLTASKTKRANLTL